MDSNIKFTRDQIQVIAEAISNIKDTCAREMAQEKLADHLISYTDADTLRYPEEFEFMVDELMLSNTMS